MIDKQYNICSDYRIKRKAITNMRAITIGKLSKQTGVNIETIRYYEKIGLLPAPHRTEGGHRQYETVHRRRLSFIRRARALGFAIDEIRTLLSLAEPGTATCVAVHQIASEHLEDIRAKISDLVRLEGILASAVAKCDANELPDCPVLEVLEGPPTI